jgi:DNA-binding GntR family transcriptional regulator
MKVKQLREFLTDDNAEVLEVMVASIMIKAIEQGDYTRLDGLLSRHLGKVKDEIEQTIKTVEDEDLDTIPRDLLLKLASSDK